jgi:pSer/pThr/pTyr-binding forkhead associated (FHA) protein
MANGRWVLKSLQTGKERELSETTPVGRGMLDGIALDSDGCSRKHAVLTVVGDTVCVEDTQSANGTFVNGERISARKLLNPGDRIAFSDDQFELLRVQQQQEMTVVRQRSTPAANAPTVNAAASDTPVSDAPAANAPIASSSTASVPAVRMPWPEVEWNDKDHTVACTPQQLAEFQKRSRELREANLAAAPVSVPCLIFREPDKTVPFTVNNDPRQEWIIGRRPDCDVCVESERVSAVHAKIVRTGSQWMAIDALSSNGMFVNNYQAGKQYLSAGDQLRFGDVECVFRLPPPAIVSQSGKGISPGIRYLLIGVAACIVAFVIGWFIF